MTSDAKIGLLLGLVFIFIIAFVVNGLPNFLRGKPSNDLTIVRVGDTKPIAQRERLVSQEVIDQNVLVRMPATENPQLTDTAQSGDVVVKSIEPISEANKITNIVAVAPPPAVKTGGIESNQSGAAKSNPAVKVQPKYYVVCEGDSLASIAKQFYGEQEGNKKINIDKIFEANRNILRSPDEIFIGQKLVIPPLVAMASGNSGSKNISDNPLLEKVPSIGGRHLDNVPQAPKNAFVGPQAKQESKNKEYVVAEGDSLWKIAANKLGDGNRYKEIVALNSSVITDEDTVEVGMRLKLPAK
jgi:nucleoid-associated protein YgaU